MLRMWLCLSAIAPLLSLRALAQAAPSHANVYELRGGIRIALPSSWHPVDSATAKRIQSVTDTLLPDVKDSAVQADLRRGTPIRLLDASDAARPGWSLDLNVSPSPGATESTFTKSTSQEVASMLGPLCGELGQLSRLMGMRVVACAPAVKTMVRGQGAALTRYVRSGSSGFFTSWLMQYPDRNVVYSLTLRAPSRDEQAAIEVFRHIWKSVNINPH